MRLFDGLFPVWAVAGVDDAAEGAALLVGLAAIATYAAYQTVVNNREFRQEFARALDATIEEIGRVFSNSDTAPVEGCPDAPPAEGQPGDQSVPVPPPIPADPTQPPGEGWEWRGRGEPGSRQGNWVRPETGEWLHPDLNHPAPIGPHWDYGDGNGGEWRVFPDGTMQPK